MPKKKKANSRKIFRRTCATANPNEYQIQRNDQILRGMRKRIRSPQTIKINVQFIHITNGSSGKVSKAKRTKQVAVLNNAYGAYGITFDYQEDDVKNVDNPVWYEMDFGSCAEREAKTQLHASPERNLNFYTAGLNGGLLGWATFPWDMEGNRDMDGVVVLDASLPGGVAKPFDLGITAVHEVGHWLGLYHTFQDGCAINGDHVDDTVSHSTPNYGKPDDCEPNGACKEGELAPVHNYMNYCDDEWLTEFTDQQMERVKKGILQYRPDFIVKPKAKTAKRKTSKPKAKAKTLSKKVKSKSRSTAKISKKKVGSRSKPKTKATKKKRKARKKK